MTEPKLQDLNRENLVYVSNLLKGIEHFVFFGTLLGLVREGDIIPHDDDVDFYVPIEQREAVIELLTGKDFFIRWEKAWNQHDCFLQLNRCFNDIETCVDFYFYQSNAKTDFILDRWNVSGTPDNKDTYIHIPKSMIFPLKTQRFFDSDIAMPAKGEGLCEFLYGNDWQKPLIKHIDYQPMVRNNRPVRFIEKTP